MQRLRSAGQEITTAEDSNLSVARYLIVLGQFIMKAPTRNHKNRY